jgi:hypothetical protein
LSYCRALIVFFGAAMVLVPSVLCAERERERERAVAGTMMLIWLVRTQASWTGMNRLLISEISEIESTWVYSGVAAIDTLVM